MKNEFIPKEEPKQETLEEAAKKLYPYNDGFQVMDIDISEQLQIAFIRGVNWQQERSYSEEEVLRLLRDFNNLIGDVESVKEWFEQFKKQNNNE